MKNIFKVMIAIFITTISAHASTMCVHSNSYVATLVPSIDGESYTLGTDGEFTVTFDYFTSSKTNGPNTVRGIASCNEVPGTPNTANNTVSTSGSDMGRYCWCTMASPLISDWVFLNDYGNRTTCASSCQTACATAVQTSAAMRTAMFGAIW